VNAQQTYDDRRGTSREAASLRARAFYGPQKDLWADCTITDISKGGAKLQVSAIYPLPPRFLLLQFHEGLVFDVRLRWRRGDLTGVAFEAERQVEGSKDADLVKLEPVWRALLSGT
jgi:PilZ domain